MLRYSTHAGKYLDQQYDTSMIKNCVYKSERIARSFSLYPAGNLPFFHLKRKLVFDRVVTGKIAVGSLRKRNGVVALEMARKHSSTHARATRQFDESPIWFSAICRVFILFKFLLLFYKAIDMLHIVVRRHTSYYRELL